MKPMIKNWQIYFDVNKGDKNRSNVIREFATFWEKGTGVFKVPGKCMLGGDVYGRDGFNDGDEIITSRIATIEMIESENLNGTPHNLMCATTKSGSKYYFYSDESSARMSLMLGDMIHTGQLNPERYFYIKRELYGSGLF